MILDTNAISSWCDGEEALLAVLPPDRPLFLPVIVLGEYRFGIKVARDRKVRENGDHLVELESTQRRKHVRVSVLDVRFGDR